MLVYWSMFGWAAIMSFILGENRSGLRRSQFGLGLLFLIFVILIGLRTETGGDWYNYQRYAELVSFERLSTAMADRETGFALITWLSSNLGWGVYGATTFCGIVLMYGVIRFAQRQPDPWLAVTAAGPYLIIVVGMGYIRQAAAIGFIMLALLNFEKRKYALFGLQLVAGTLFHVSALIVLPAAGIVLARRRPLFLVPIIIGSIPAVYLLTGDRFDRMVNNYVAVEYDSSGTLIRLLMNAVPSVLFLIYRKRFQLSNEVLFLWTMFAVMSCALLVIFPLSPSSTVIDRFALYLIPIQLFVFGHLPVVMAGQSGDVRLINFFVIGYFALVQLVWLHGASHAHAWLPYRSLLVG